MISNSSEFNDYFNRVFPQVSTRTLSTVKNNRIRIELGGNKKGRNRVQQCLYRCDQILYYCFNKKDVWARITLWSNMEKTNLINAGVRFNKFDLAFEDYASENETLFIYKKQYYGIFFHPIILSIINYEINEDPYANITCYFINFSIPLVINIYDDRGMDIVSNNVKLFKSIEEHFNSWVIYPDVFP